MNPNPKIDQIKPYQFESKRPNENDRETMIDMIKYGTDVNAFIEFWSREAGYKPSSLKTMYYELKKLV